MAKRKRRAHTGKPQEIDRDTWFYDGPRGIEITRWETDGTGKRNPIMFTIPWGKLERAVKRHNTFV